MKRSLSFTGYTPQKQKDDSGASESNLVSLTGEAPEKGHLFKDFISKFKGIGPRTRESTNSSHSSRYSSPDEAQLDSNKRDIEYQLGKSVKVKGRLKTFTFANYKLTQKIYCSDRITKFDKSSLHKSDSVSSLQIPRDHDYSTSHTVWIMKFNNNGVFLAAGRNNGTVTVWEKFPSHNTHKIFGEKGTSVDYLDETPKRIYKGHQGAILDINWSPDNLLLSSSMDNTVRLWSVDHDECLLIFEHSDCVTCATFHPFDSNFFATGTFDGKIRIWNIRERQLVCESESLKIPITAIYITRNGTNLVAGTFTGQCIFYAFGDLQYITQIHVSNHRYSRHHNKVIAIEKMPLQKENEEKFLVTTADSKIRLFNLRDGSLAKTYSGAELKHGRSAASFSSNGEFIIVAGEDKNVYIFDTFSQDLNLQFSGVLSTVINRESSKECLFEKFQASAYPTTCACFSMDNEVNLLVLVADTQGTIFLYSNSI